MTDTSPGARFAAVFAAMLAAHHVADYWPQTDHQAANKGRTGSPGEDAAGAAACLAHVASYTVAGRRPRRRRRPNSRPARPQGPHMTPTAGDTTRRPGCRARRHDTASAYTRGCRCADAREAWRLYGKRRRQGRQPPFLCDATGTRRRLQALVAIGWPTTTLADRLGIPPTVVSRWCHHARRVHPHTAARVARLYARLSMTPGPCPRARRRARAAGWVPPLAWDDNTIDTPAAAPAGHGAEHTTPPRGDVDAAAVLRACHGHPPRALTVAERVAAVRRLAAAGHADADISARLGLGGARVVQRIRRAHAIPTAAAPGRVA